MNPRFIPDGHGHAELVILVSHPHTLSPRKCSETTNVLAESIRAPVYLQHDDRRRGRVCVERPACAAPDEAGVLEGAWPGGRPDHAFDWGEGVYTYIPQLANLLDELTRRADEPRALRFVSSPYFFPFHELTVYSFFFLMLPYLHLSLSLPVRRQKRY